MKAKIKVLTAIILAAGLCLAFSGSALSEEADALERVYADAFPCDTVPPKCPEAVNFLLQITNAFPNSIELVTGGYFDLDSGGICDELYIEVGAAITLPVAGLDAEMFLIRPPADEWQDHLALNLQIADLSLGGAAILWGHGCLGFLEFGIPLGGDLGISLDYLIAGARYSMWRDTATDEILLQDEFSDVQLAGLEINTGLGGLVDAAAEAAVILFARDAISEALFESPDGSLAGLVEGLMDDLYHTEPCGCMMLPQHRGRPPVNHILANLAPYLLPLGLVAFVRRRLRK